MALFIVVGMSSKDVLEESFEKKDRTRFGPLVVQFLVDFDLIWVCHGNDSAIKNGSY